MQKSKKNTKEKDKEKNSRRRKNGKKSIKVNEKSKLGNTCELSDIYAQKSVTL